MVEHLSEVHLMVGCRLEDMEVSRPMVERHMEALEVSEAHLIGGAPFGGLGGVGGAPLGGAALGGFGGFGGSPYFGGAPTGANPFGRFGIGNFRTDSRNAGRLRNERERPVGAVCPGCLNNRQLSATTQQSCSTRSLWKIPSPTREDLTNS
jgi:hypothetical protein